MASTPEYSAEFRMFGLFSNRGGSCPINDYVIIDCELPGEWSNNKIDTFDLMYTVQ